MFCVRLLFLLLRLARLLRRRPWSASHWALSANDVVQQFSDEMAHAGAVCNDQIVPDGQLHRFDVDGDKTVNRSGWYVLHRDGVPAGAYGCWKRDITANGSPPVPMSGQNRGLLLMQFEELQR